MSICKIFNLKLIYLALCNLFQNKLSIFLLFIILVNYFISWRTSTSTEVLTIFTIIFLSSYSEVYQENRRKEMSNELKKNLRAKMKIVHEGQLKETEDFAVGDIVYLQQGDRTFCDVFLFDYAIDEYMHKSTVLTADESTVTGESYPVAKFPINTVFEQEGSDVYDKENQKLFLDCVSDKCKFMLKKNLCKDYFEFLNKQNPCISEFIVIGGSYIHQGSMFGIINSDKNEFYKLHCEDDTSQNNIITQTTRFAEILTYSVSIFSLFVFGLAFYKNGSLFQSLKISITLALTVMPEGLDASIKAILISMSNRIMKYNVYVNDYLKLEKLGNIDVICLDKTGTLTHNNQQIDNVFLFTNLNENMRLISVKQNNKAYECDLLCILFRYCNEVIRLDGHFTGDPLDLALINHILSIRKDIPVPLFIEKVPFCPIKKTVEIKVIINDKSYFLVKGAPENILASCNYVSNGNSMICVTDKIRESLLNQISKHSSSGKRIIACAYKETNVTDLILLCIVTFYDPPRDSVKKSIKWCKANKIEVTVITGDSFLTTKSVCESIGLLTRDSKQLFVSGSQIRTIDNFDDLCSVYRAEPNHKLQIIKHYKSQGKSVLMAGDGLNDILAMKESCVSMAMGSGSYYCKELSDLVVLDDNFDNIVECIKLGRKGSHNIFCLFKYLISSNLGELLCVIFSYIFNDKECLSSSNLLLINLITDGIPVIVICFNEGDSSKQKEKISLPLVLRSLMIGFYIGISTFLVYKTSISKKGHSHKEATTESTVYIIFCELINTLNNANLRKPILMNKIWVFNKWALPVLLISVFIIFIMVKIKYLRVLLSFSDLTFNDLTRIFILSTPVLILDDLMKVFFNE